MVVVGVISDTHGVVRPGVHKVFEEAGVSLILHAGDVGGDEVLDELGLIAPVHAVFGNTDTPGDPRLAASLERTIEGVRIHVSHGHELGVPKPGKLLKEYDADVIIYGHTHIPRLDEAKKRLVLNPGAAGPRRFGIEPSVAILRLESGVAQAELVKL